MDGAHLSPSLTPFSLLFRADPSGDIRLHQRKREGDEEKAVSRCLPPMGLCAIRCREKGRERLTLPHSENIFAPLLDSNAIVLLFTSSFSPFVTWESGHSFPFPNGSPVIMLVMVMRRIWAVVGGETDADGGFGRERVNVTHVDHICPIYNSVHVSVKFV